MAILTDRTELAEAPNDSDLVHVVDVSDTTDNAAGTSKKLTIANLLSGLSSVYAALSHTHTASQVTDFDAEVANNSAVAANTAKVGVTTEEANPDVVSQAEAEAGTATTERTWTAQRVAQAIAALAAGGGASALSDLSDVDASVGSPSDGDIMVFRSAGGDWVLESKPAGGSNPAMADVTDVTLTSLATGEILYWNGSAWINRTLAEAGIAAASHTHTISELSDVTAFIATLLDDADAATARTTLGVDPSGTDNAPTASDATAGKVELATIAETDAGTDATRALTANALAGSYAGSKNVSIQVVDGGTATATGDGKAYFMVPAELDGMNLVDIKGGVSTAGTTGTTDVQVHNVTDTADILSTKLTIDSGATTSETAATAAVINTSNDDVAEGDILRIDVDAISTTPANGLFVTLTFRKP